MMLRFLIEKEFKQLIRNAFVPKLIFIFPCMIMLLFPWAVNLEVKNINISVINNDKSPYSTRLVNKIASSKYFHIDNISASYNQSLESIETGAADIILEIESGFEKDIVTTGRTNKVMIAANAVNGTKGGLGSSYLMAIINDFAGDVRALQMPTGQQPIPIISIVPQNRFNPHLDYKVFITPALMVMLLTILCGFLPAFNIVGEKEQGTIEQINVTPVGKFSFILAKLIPYWIIGFVVLSICFGLAALIYGITPKGNLGTIYLFAGLFVLVVSGLGLVISNHSHTMQQAMFVMFFFLIVFLLMSGLFTPVGSMPQWAQNIAIFNPLKYFTQVMRTLYLKGGGISNLTSQMLALGCFAVALNSWAILSYRKSA